MDLGAVLQGHAVRLRNALAGDDRERATHEARRVLKEMRGTLRLAAPRKEDRAGLARLADAVRALARRLAGARDARVGARTAERLARRVPDHATAAILATLAATLHQQAEAHEAASSARERRSVGEIARHAGALDLRREPAWIASAARRAYATARRRMRKALASRDAEALHDARSAAVRLQVQLSVVGGLAEGRDRRLGRRLRRLAASLDGLRSLLGDHHDLFMLSPVVARMVPQDHRSAALVLHQIDRRMRNLERHCAGMAVEVFSLNPDEVERKVLRALAGRKGARVRERPR